MTNNVVKTLDFKNDLKGTTPIKNVFGISQTICIIGDHTAFISGNNPSFCLYFIAVILPKNNVLRLICVNNFRYFDIENFSKYNLLQFEDVFTYCKEKIVLDFKQLLIQPENLKKKTLQIIQDIDSPLWKEFYRLYSDQSKFFAPIEFKDWVQTTTKNSELDLAPVQKIDVKKITIMTQHILNYHAYISNMFDFSTSIYNEPNPKTLEEDYYWPRG